MHADVDKLVRQELGLGAPDQGIYHAKDPRLPQFEFEWHPKTQKVYRLDLPGRWQDGAWVPAGAGTVARGRCVAEHCMTHGMFLGFVQTFCRGYLLTFADEHRPALGAVLPDLIKETDSCPTR